VTPQKSIINLQEDRLSAYTELISIDYFLDNYVENDRVDSLFLDCWQALYFDLSSFFAEELATESTKDHVEERN